MIDLAPILPTLLSLLGAALLAGVAWILRTLNAQNTAMTGHSQALAVLIARVDPAVEKATRLEAAHADLKERVLRLELAQGLPAPPAASSPVTVNV
jgi:hypothetical protein